VKSFPLIVLAAIFIASCNDKIEEDPIGVEESVLYRYFPLDPGSFIVYSVDSIIHRYEDDHTNNPDSLIDTFHYEVKEVVDSDFIDGEGDTAFRISRYFRDSASGDWNFSTLWTAKVTSQSAQRVEENIRFVKISFPIKLNKTWNGNYYNFLPPEDYSIEEANTPLDLGGFNFDSSLTVLESDDFNLIHRIYKESKYAYGIGLISRERDSVNLTQFGEITNGIEFMQTIIDYSPR
jgi:hypothetical protein